MRSPELFALDVSVLLFVAHVVAQALYTRAEMGQDYMMGPRDEGIEPKGILAGRATRALRNFLENYTPFVALDLGLIATGRTGGWGAVIWVLARIAYLPLYLSGIQGVRSICWVVSIIGLLMMLARLAGI